MNNNLYIVLLLGLVIIYLYKKNNKLFGGLDKPSESMTKVMDDKQPVLPRTKTTRVPYEKPSLRINPDDPIVLQNELNRLRAINNSMESEIDNNVKEIKFLNNIIKDIEFRLHSLDTEYRNYRNEVRNSKMNTILSYDKNNDGLLDKNEQMELTRIIK